MSSWPNSARSTISEPVLGRWLVDGISTAGRLATDVSVAGLKYENSRREAVVMNSVLIAGVESVAGGNLAAVLQKSFQVCGVTPRSGIQIENCRIITSLAADLAGIQQLIRAERPDWIVFCGAAARSCWDGAESLGECFDDVSAPIWATAADQADIAFTMISSDAVFTGPWMSHGETDTDHFCETPQSARLRQIESSVLGACPDALIVRTNTFGWSPDASTPGFAESMIKDADPAGCFVRHAAPILATDLACLLLKARQAGLAGSLHLASAERINAFNFAERLCERAGCNVPEMPDQLTLTRPVRGFGSGETTLNCDLAREELGVRMPLIEDGLGQFLKQQDDGFLTLLRCQEAAVPMVA